MWQLWEHWWDVDKDEIINENKDIDKDENIDGNKDNNKDGLMKLKILTIMRTLMRCWQGWDHQWK